MDPKSNADSKSRDPRKEEKRHSDLTNRTTANILQVTRFYHNPFALLTLYSAPQLTPPERLKSCTTHRLLPPPKSDLQVSSWKQSANTHVPKAKPSPYAKRWWTEEHSALRKH